MHRTGEQGGSAMQVHESLIDLIGPDLGDPKITVMIHQPISVTKEPMLRRAIQQIVGTTIVG
jgi:hypothetical protein